MATYTDNYQLTKPLYSETADVAAINNNMDKIDDIMHASQVSLAPAYDQNETYNTGDVVMYEFLMYECLEDNVTGVWDATKWQRTTAGEHGGGGTASDVEYDNTDSGMTATNVQDAIDELQSEIEDIPSVEANPQGAATEELTKIGIGNTIYEIDREEITGEASGAIASFSDGSNNPLVKLEADINPIQDLHGYDKPWAAGAGKNKLPSSNAINTTLNGITFKTSGDGIYEVSGTATAGTNCEFTFSQAVSLVAGKKLSFFNNFTGYNLFFRKDGSDKTYYNFSSANRTVTIAAADAVEFDTLRITVESGATINGKFALMMYEGDTTTTYEPYSNICPISGRSSVEVTVADDTTDPTTEETYEITLGRTVYGGTLDVTNGVLTVDRYLYSFTGNETFISNPSAWGNYAFLYNTGVDLKSSFSTLSYCKSSHLELNPEGGWGYLTPDTFMIAGTNYMGIGFDGTETELKAWLSGQKTANTPVQIMGVLETPTTVTLTPTEVDSLFGNNNIRADSGDSDVVYIRDIDKAFNILWNAVMNSNSGTRSLNLMKGAISETKEDIEEPIKEEEETKEGNDENQR